MDEQILDEQYEENSIRVIFTTKSDQVLSDIIKKYSLEENDDQRFKKIQEGKNLNEEVLVSLIKDFARETILKQDLINSLITIQNL